MASTTTSSVARLLNNGTGTFTVTPLFVGSLNGALEMVSSDFNGDNRPDFVVTSSTGVTVYACRNNMGTSYVCNGATGPQINASVDAADVNSDGKMDFVVASPLSNVVMAHTGDGNFGFTQNDTNGIATNWTDFKLADINKDGYTDIVYGSSGNAVGVCLGKNDGTFSAATGIRATTSPVNRLAIGQFNTGTDQKDDFAATTNAGVQYSLSAAQ